VLKRQTLGRAHVLKKQTLERCSRAEEADGGVLKRQTVELIRSRVEEADVRALLTC
jgi:hypothetical protein